MKQVSAFQRGPTTGKFLAKAFPLVPWSQKAWLEPDVFYFY